MPRLRTLGVTVVALFAVIGSATTFVLAHAVLTPIDGNGRASDALREIERLSHALEQYRADTGAYPTTAQGLAVLVSPPPGCPSTVHASARPHHLIDPWGNALVYRSPGVRNPASFDLCSLGSDETAGGSDHAADITNFSLAICE